MSSNSDSSSRPRPDHASEGSDPDSLPSGTGPQAEGEQSDISSGGSTDE